MKQMCYLIVTHADDLCDGHIIDGDPLLAPDLDDQGPPAHCPDHPVLLLLSVNLLTSHQLTADYLALEYAIVQWILI